jgi:signal transduction histidine kinase
MRRRLVLAIAGVAAAAVTLFALPLALVLERSYRAEELLRLQRDTVAATRGIDVSQTPDQIELPRSSDQLGIYSVSGPRVAGAGPAQADASTRTALRARRPTGVAVGGRLVVAVPLLNGERITGVVRAQRSQAAVIGRSHRAWLALAALAAGVVAVAVLAALALGRRLSQPLSALAAAARRVGEGDFAVRVGPTRIAEIDDVGSALNSSSQRIDELVSRERTFSADASHQLRTPLAALRLELESAELQPGAAAAEIAAAMAQVDRLQSTIETLLNVGRGGPNGDRRADLVQAANELEVRWHGPLAGQGRPLRTRLEVESAVAAISPAVLAEIAEVLLQNASVHGEGAVDIVVRRLADALVLEVSDQGPGFGPDPELAFQRGEGAGHGIGLALARSLAHAEGAQLAITRPGPGPTISLLVSSA